MREMKDSGVEWIGEIPAHWDAIRFRFIAKITTGNQDTQNADPDGEYPFYVRSPIVERCKNYTFDGEGILMAGDGAGAGRVFHLVDGKYAVHQRVYRFYDFQYMNPVLLKYYLENLFATVMDYGSAKTTVPSVRLPMIQDFVVCVPPDEEQMSILAFLSNKCSQVDTLITNVQAQIEKLKSYKQSLITEVVTKGLAATVPMKDSGVEWLGMVPEKWAVHRIANLYSERSENGHADLPILTVSIHTGVSDYEVADADKDRVFIRMEDRSKYKRVCPGDLTYNMMRAWQGAFGAVRVEGMVSPAYVVAKPKNPAQIDSRYIEALLRTPSAIEEMHRYSRGIVDFRLRLYWPEFRSIHICLPPIEEQTEIADYIDEKSKQIDKLIAIKQKKIDKLNEYKKSLIYEYVTGKRAVV